MKRIGVCFLLIMAVLSAKDLQAQEALQKVYVEPIEPVQIEAAFNQTTNLLFPFAVTSVDWGSNGIIVRQRKGAKNILHVKAAKKDFPVTNLSVVTSDGQFYSFVVHYIETAENLSYRVGREKENGLATVEHNEQTLGVASDYVRDAQPFLNISASVPTVKLQLKGVYLEQNYLWLKIHVQNHSLINFPVEYIRFFMKDKKSMKRKIVHEEELLPVYVDPLKLVVGTGSPKMVFGFLPFTVPKGKRLVIQIGEAGNGRFLQLQLKGKHILRAQTTVRKQTACAADNAS